MSSGIPTVVSSFGRVLLLLVGLVLHLSVKLNIERHSTELLLLEHALRSAETFLLRRRVPTLLVFCLKERLKRETPQTRPLNANRHVKVKKC